MLKRILVIVGLMLALQGIVHAGQFAFSAPVNVRLSGGAQAVSVADFNGDGRDDLAAIVQGHLEIALQENSGALAAPLVVQISSGDFYSIKAADIGADGTRKILVGHSKGLAVYKWNGAGFDLDNHPSQFPCFFMATADLNFDGAVDVFCHGELGDAALFYSQPSNGFELPVYMLTPAYHYAGYGTFIMQAQLKDVTGDGKPDLLLAAGGINSFFVYRHDAGRGFLQAVAYPYPEENDLGPNAIEVADLDGDGSNEVIVAKSCNRPCSEVLIYKRDVYGYLHLSKRFPTYDNPSALLTSDIDEDGKQDLLVGHSGWFAVGRYMGSAQGLHDTELLSSVQTQAGSNRYALGDLDHDGKVDLAVANSLGVSVLYGGRRASNDFNNDLVSDLLWRHSNGSNAIWLSANSATTQAIDVADPTWSIQAIGDFDGDGVDDVFLRNGLTGANEVQQTGYDPLPITAVINQAWQVVGAGDFDGDGNSDLCWRNLQTGANTIWKSANPARVQATSAVTDLRWEVVGVGDFDGDGRSDILWRHSATGRNVVWRAGSRASQQALRGVSNLAWKVAGVGDFNGDGKDDVVWRNTSTGADTIWLSANGATQQTVKGVTNQAWIIAAVGDYNGDGSSDLAWRNIATGSNVIWRSANYNQQQSLAPMRDLRWKIIR